ncbi:YceI family protein [Virgisporangium ochraceum]|jgi:polyisoprenoid-binding protein YceI|uniref:Polyisoprenoid-binding protein n=1 Tax=Virgisporangium ochraceum TaxID=65505 RepID=A0A8J3ZQB2_9ACTN|nr:YceI family protein [Virgisporangium ochraceum]GIJ66330.1 polyisoprenoid-binding protein [Virgisporangium ochraceum]
MTAPALDTRTFDGVTIPTPGTFALDASHSEVAAVARHLVVSKVRGTFANVTGTIVIAEDPLQSSVTASIPAETINTNSPDRDNHLRSADFLDVEKYPTLDFRSTGVVSHKGTEFVLRGDLTIRGVTREVDLKVEYDGVAKSPWGQEVIAFSATTEFDREDFGMTWNQALETGGVLVGKKIAVHISAEAIRQAAE